MKHVLAIALIAIFVGPKFLRPTFKVHKEGAVFITGASSGIGLDAAQALTKLGYTVFGSVRNKNDAATLEVTIFPPLRI